MNNNHIYQIQTPIEWTKQDAINYQISDKYHPAGYGFYGFKSVKQEDGSYLNTWWRSKSCD